MFSRLACWAAILAAILAAPPVLGRQLQLPWPTAAELKILNALDSTTQMEFIDTPLSEVIEYLKDMHAIEIQLDQRTLDDVGIGTDTPITRSIAGIKLRSALRLLLADLDMTYIVRDEVLLITTRESARAPENMIVRLYPVAALVGDGEEMKTNVARLVQAVTVLPGPWRVADGCEVAAGPSTAPRPPILADDGTSGAIAVAMIAGQPVLVVRQSYAMHARVLELLASLETLTDPEVTAALAAEVEASRAALRAKPAKPQTPPSQAPPPPSDDPFAAPPEGAAEDPFAPPPDEKPAAKPPETGDDPFGAADGT